MNKFTNDLLAAMASSLAPDQLCALRTQLAVVLQRYDVTEKCTALDTWHGQLPECYHAFMVGKAIEGASPKTLDAYRLYIEHMLRNVYKPVEETRQTLQRLPIQGRGGAH